MRTLRPASESTELALSPWETLGDEEEAEPSITGATLAERQWRQVWGGAKGSGEMKWS